MRTIRVRADLAIGLVALLSITCGRTIARAHRPAIGTDRARYVLEPGRFGDQATIVATFRAPADTAAYILHCNGAISWGIQRLVQKRWTDEWIATTNACLSEPIVVTGGGTYTDTLVLVSGGGAMVRPGAPDEDIQPGTYRLVWYHVLTSFDVRARPFGDELPLERRVSGPITIERAS